MNGLHRRFSPALCRMMAALAMSAGVIPGHAPAACPAAPDRTAGMRLAPDGRTLADLGLAVDGGQHGQLRLAGVGTLHGPCADEVEAFKMGLIAFKDGAVFASGVDGGFSPRPGATLLPQAGPAPLSVERNALAQAQFIMATEVDAADTPAGKRALHVGLWRLRDAHVVAAYIRDERGVSAHVELLRSAQPIRSVTYFPAPDTNAGTLGLVQRAPDGVVLLSMSWDHIALSRSLRAGK